MEPWRSLAWLVGLVIKVWRSLALLLGLVLGDPASGFGQIALRAGEYEVTTDMNLAGLSPNDQAALSSILKHDDVRRQCRTAEQVGDASAIAHAVAREPEVACKLSA